MEDDSNPSQGGVRRIEFQLAGSKLDGMFSFQGNAIKTVAKKTTAMQAFDEVLEGLERAMGFEPTTTSLGS